MSKIAFCFPGQGALEAGMRFAVGVNGAGEGYADVGAPDGGGPKAYVDLRVVPGKDDALSLLFDWCETRAEERAGPGGVIWYFVPIEDEVMRELLRRSGYSAAWARRSDARTTSPSSPGAPITTCSPA